MIMKSDRQRQAVYQAIFKAEESPASLPLATEARLRIGVKCYLEECLSLESYGSDDSNWKPNPKTLL